MERCCRVWDVLAALGGGTPLLLGGGLPGGKGEGGGEEVRRKGRVVFAYRRGKESAGGGWCGRCGWVVAGQQVGAGGL